MCKPMDVSNQPETRLTVQQYEEESTHGTNSPPKDSLSPLFHVVIMGCIYWVLSHIGLRCGYPLSQLLNNEAADFPDSWWS